MLRLSVQKAINHKQRRPVGEMTVVGTGLQDLGLRQVI